MPLKQILAMESTRKEDDPSSRTTVTQPAPALHRKGPNFAKKKDKFGRKRSQSFSGVNSKFCPPYKYRTRPMLPTKFLLGGNICDPLNLNSLQDEEVNRTVNAITPKSSPIPTPPQRRGHIEVIIPPNIHDPLNLIDCADDAEYEQQLTSPLKKGNKRRKKKKRTSSATTEPSDADISASEAQTPDLSNDSAKIPDLEPTWSGAEEPAPKEKLARVTRELKLELTPVKEKKRKSDSHKEGVKKIRRLDSMDKIVSPVVPQPGAWLKRALQFNRNAGPSNRGQNSRPGALKAKESGGKVPHFRDKNKAYQYGNYNRYYGYRNPNREVDSRLRCFAAHRHIFEGRDILDIGCNIGHITLSIARDFGAKSVVGIDIDKKLIGIARKNVRHYVNCDDSPRDSEAAAACSPRRPDKNDKCFPISMPILYGPVDVPGMQNDEVRGRGFPHNVTFVQGNYVLEDDSLLSTEQPQFDVILCLSITKWLHLNWGDAGLKQAFRRMYAQLKPGGKLILEPQSWASYKHKKTLTETIYKNYHSIEFFPEKFTQYLLSSEVGFAKSEIMGQPHHAAKGFQRPIQVFTRSNLSPSQSQRSYSITPSHTLTSSGCAASAGGGKQVYTCLPSPEVRVEEPARGRVELEPVRGGGSTSSRCTASGTAGGQLPVAREQPEGTQRARAAGRRGDNGTGQENQQAARARVALEASGTSSEQLEPVRGVGEEQGAAESSGREGRSGDTGTRRENQRAEPVGRELVATNANSAGPGGGERVDKGPEGADKPGPGGLVGNDRETSGQRPGARENGTRVTDLRAVMCNTADTRADVPVGPEPTTGAGTESRGPVGNSADQRAAVALKPGQPGTNAEGRVEGSEIVDNQARITDKQRTVNQTSIADNQARRPRTPLNPGTRLNRPAKQTYSADNQTTALSSPVDQTAPPRSPLDQAKLANSALHHVAPLDRAVNRPQLARSPVNRPKPANNPPDRPAAPTTATSTSPSADNHESRPAEPQNRVPRAIATDNVGECRGKHTSNAPSTAGGHLGSTTSAASVICATKRKHTAAAGSPDADGTPAKRQFVSPVKRKTSTLAVNRKYTKRKNDQSTTADGGSTLAPSGEGETRLADALANREDGTAACHSTTAAGTSTSATDDSRTAYRAMQTTKCIMENT